MDVFNIFLIFLMGCIGIGIVIGGLYMGGVCSVVTLFGESDDPECAEDGGAADDSTTSCSTFTGCPTGKVLNPVATGTTVDECCIQPAPNTCGSKFTGSCGTGKANNSALPCPATGDCDATYCCQDVTTSSGVGDTDGTTRRFETIAPHQDFMRCSAALAASQETGDPYSGDCPWPQKVLSEQRAASSAEDKGWIQSSLAAPGFGVSGTQAGKNDILRICCPDRIDTYPMCRGTPIGAYGVPGINSEGGVERDATVLATRTCGNITKNQWGTTIQRAWDTDRHEGLLYARTGVLARLTGDEDGRGNPLTDAQKARLNIQCNLPDGNTDAWHDADDDDRLDEIFPGTNFDGVTCARY